MGVSFDCFGTLVTVDRPDEPWEAVADACRARGVRVPDDWADAYRTSHREYAPGEEAPLDEHVALALASRGVDVTREAARAVVLDAFDGEVAVRPGGAAALAAARDRGPVAACSNCSVPGLVRRTLERAGLSVDIVVASADCGWRKPHSRTFEAAADALGVPLEDLIHVGDDPRTDGGAERAGATTVLLDDVPLEAFPDWLAREGGSQ